MTPPQRVIHTTNIHLHISDVWQRRLGNFSWWPRAEWPAQLTYLIVRGSKERARARTRPGLRLPISFVQGPRHWGILGESRQSVGFLFYFYAHDPDRSGSIGRSSTAHMEAHLSLFVFATSHFICAVAGGANVGAFRDIHGPCRSAKWQMSRGALQMGLRQS